MSRESDQLLHYSLLSDLPMSGVLDGCIDSDCEASVFTAECVDDAAQVHFAGKGCCLVAESHLLDQTLAILTLQSYLLTAERLQ